MSFQGMKKLTENYSPYEFLLLPLLDKELETTKEGTIKRGTIKGGTIKGGTIKRGTIKGGKNLFSF
jgi:hypothetical protein